MKTDFWKLGLGASLMLLQLASAQIQQSTFDGPTLDPFWIFKDPRGGCTLVMTGTQAKISIPSGLSRDPVSLPQGGNRAPRLVQSVAPFGSDVGNFAIYAKFDGVEERQYHLQGMEAIQDDKNYVRCEFYSDSCGIHALLYTFDNNGGYEQQRNRIIWQTCGVTPLLLGLERVGNLFTQFYSTDLGASWIWVDTASHVMNVDSVAVYAATSDSVQLPRVPEIWAPAFDGLIDYFKTASSLPIQLASFTATQQSSNSVLLRWMTLSETNNYGFEVQKAPAGANTFVTIENSFVPGHGTTIVPQQYSYLDRTATPGRWLYRLKQIDLGGPVHYSEPIQIDVTTSVENIVSQPVAFSLGQNFPNPFNPTTEITYSIPKESRTTLEVFTVLGQKVMTLVDRVMPEGSYTERLDASKLPSGIYLYKLTAAGHFATKRMTVIK
jgi:hypothetical protein